MTDAKAMAREIIGRIILASPRLRRLGWRVGRSLYCLARGEARIDDMRFDGELDLQRRVILANRAVPNFVAFDIGANQGDWTLALLKSAAKHLGALDRLNAHAFEPVPATRQRLAERLKAIAGQTVRINASAASDKSGAFDMVVMTNSGGTNSLVYDEDMAKKAIGFVTVPVTTLDLYCADAGITHIHIIKCDTEGHDLAVIRGSIGMLQSKSIDIFQFEYNHRWITARSYLKDVFDLVHELPYRIARIMPNSVEIIDEWHPELERYYQSNYVLILESALPWLSATAGSFDASNCFA